MDNLQIIFKRIFDLIFALFLLFILSPLFLIVSILIFALDGQPLFFIQERPGKNEKLFKLIKFRTMRTNILKSENPHDIARVTSLGRFLRKSSLDEIPQLINVILGDISFVGPRPLLIEYLPLYNQSQRKRHNVMPGITGWAQVNGRNSITWEKKFDYDVWYVEHWSLWLDFKILLMTTWKIFKRTEVNSSEDITMESFKGSNEI